MTKDTLVIRNMFKYRIFEQRDISTLYKFFEDAGTKLPKSMPGFLADVDLFQDYMLALDDICEELIDIFGCSFETVKSHLGAVMFDPDDVTAIDPLPGEDHEEVDLRSFYVCAFTGMLEVASDTMCFIFRPQDFFDFILRGLSYCVFQDAEHIGCLAVHLSKTYPIFTQYALRYHSSVLINHGELEEFFEKESHIRDAVSLLCEQYFEENSEGFCTKTFYYKYLQPTKKTPSDAQSYCDWIKFFTYLNFIKYEPEMLNYLAKVAERDGISSSLRMYAMDALGIRIMTHEDFAGGSAYEVITPTPPDPKEHTEEDEEIVKNTLRDAAITILARNIVDHVESLVGYHCYNPSEIEALAATTHSYVYKTCNCECDEEFAAKADMLRWKATLNELAPTQKIVEWFETYVHAVADIFGATHNLPHLSIKRTVDAFLYYLFDIPDKDKKPLDVEIMQDMRFRDELGRLVEKYPNIVTINEWVSLSWAFARMVIRIMGYACAVCAPEFNFYSHKYEEGVYKELRYNVLTTYAISLCPEMQQQFKVSIDTEDGRKLLRRVTEALSDSAYIKMEVDTFHKIYSGNYLRRVSKWDKLCIRVVDSLNAIGSSIYTTLRAAKKTGGLSSAELSEVIHRAIINCTLTDLEEHTQQTQYLRHFISAQIDNDVMRKDVPAKTLQIVWDYLDDMCQCSIEVVNLQAIFDPYRTQERTDTPLTEVETIVTYGCNKMTNTILKNYNSGMMLYAAAIFQRCVRQACEHIRVKYPDYVKQIDDVEVYTPKVGIPTNRLKEIDTLIVTLLDNPNFIDKDFQKWMQAHPVKKEDAEQSEALTEVRIDDDTYATNSGYGWWEAHFMLLNTPHVQKIRATAETITDLLHELSGLRPAGTYTKKIIDKLCPNKDELEYIQLLEEDNAKLTADVEHLQRELEDLKQQRFLDSTGAWLSTPDSTESTIGLQYTGAELLEGEVRYQVLKILQSYVKRHDGQRSRTVDVANTILEQNEFVDYKAMLRDKLVRAFKTNSFSKSSFEGNMKQIGFEVNKLENGHRELYPEGFKQYRYTIASTPSDRRAADNLVQDITRMLF